MKRFDNELICGFPISKIKKNLKKHQSASISINTLFMVIEDKKSAIELLNGLKEEGYIEEISDNNYIVSLRGKMLINTQIKSILDESTIEKTISKVLARVKDVNTSETHLYYINQVSLCYEYLEGTDSVIELCFYIKLITKHEDEKIRDLLENRKRRETKKRFSNFLQELFYPKLAVTAFVKSKIRGIVVSSEEEINCKEKKIIYLRNSAL